MSGIMVSGDVITTTIDGVDLNAMYETASNVLAAWNAQRSALDALLSTPVTIPAEAVAQVTTRDDFEEASEFGLPRAVSLKADVLRLGFPLRFFDAATRYTWKFLVDAPAPQVQAVQNLVLEADSRQTHKGVLGALLAPPVGAVNENGTPIFGLWNGDGNVPPAYNGVTFDGTHNHYFTSGSTTLDGIDVETLITAITHHGYGTNPGDQVLLLVNPAEGKAVRQMRAGVTVGGSVTSYDFIPSTAAPAYLTTEQIIGDRAPATYAGLVVAGSIGATFVIEESLIPAGYVLAVATGGDSAQTNPVAFRQHIRPELQGLRQVAGPNSGYPLQESTFARAFGCGVRHRGAAAVMQVTASGTYTAPVLP